MTLLSLQEATLSFGTQPLLDKAALSIEEKERIAVVGRNGSGKSTLLKLLNKELVLDNGKIIRQQKIITARLEQDIPSATQGSVYEVVARGLGEAGQLLVKYHQLSEKMMAMSDPTELEALQHLQKEIDFHHAWDLAYKIENIISKMQLPGDLDFNALSGGLKRRVLLGQLLVQEPDIILLDEPTNHLDLEAILWLEKFISGFNGTVIFITHDRTFLQKIANRIIEIDRGIIRSYPGNYQQYLDRKAHELEVESTHQKNFDKKLADEEVWLRQGVKARRTRNEGRVRALKKLREIRLSRRVVVGKANMQLQKSDLSGKLVIEAKHIRHSFQGKAVINQFSTDIMRGDKIGIIGPNGVGKTTLLKILLGKLQPDEGTIRHGTKLEIAYFDQLRAELDEDKSVVENISYGDQFVTINDKSVHVIGYLQDFLFTPERSRTAVRLLSGGERNRLLLARLFTKPANVLVMDEPTNDLDIETLELLEELLLNYEGTLLIVSHDRSFINNVVTSTFVFEGEGQITEYVGGYDDYLAQCPLPSSSAAILPKKPKEELVKKPPVKLDFNQQRELRSLEQRIEKLEALTAQIHASLASPELYDPQKTKKLAKLQDELQNAEQAMVLLMQEWERLMG